MNPPRFAFLVHPLLPWHRRVMAVRRLHLPMLVGSPASTDAVGVTAHLRFHTREGVVDGRIVAVPDLPGQLVADQARALAMQERAARVALAEGAGVIGLGSALAVVAGRGSALAELVDVPVTTGHASTAWATTGITQQVLADRSGPVGVLGFKGAVGDAVAGALAAAGHEVWVDATGRAAEKRAAKVGCRPAPAEEVAGRCTTLVGCSTTGPVLEPTALRPDTVLVDLALPPTLAPGPRPPGLTLVAGETVTLPGRLQGWVWGRIWLALAAYGRGVVYACLAEPLAMAALAEGPYSTGRRLDPQRVQAAGAALDRLGFVPVARRRRA